MSVMDRIAAAQLAEQIKATQNLLNFYGRDLVLHRIERATDGAGGSGSAVPDDLEPQRLYFGPVETAVEEVHTEGGLGTRAEYMLIGLPGVDVKRGDFFEVNDDKYNVVWVDHEDYQTKCEVLRYTP